MNVQMFIKKSKELSATMDGSASISDSEFAELSNILEAAATSIDSSSAIKAATLGLKIVKQWPAGDKLGGLDVIRSVVGEIRDPAVLLEIVEDLFEQGKEITDISNNALMTSRIFVNMFESDVGRLVIKDDQIRERILDYVREIAVKNISKISAIALSTLILK